MSEPLVKVNQGTLKGDVVEGELGKFLTFKGIPYATPPVGDLRFKDPQPPNSWEGVRDASKEGGVGAQIYFMNFEYVGGDDCLYLNVSTQNLSGKKPVMVWIHGGGFTVGSGNIDFARPDYLVQHDIIYVSINYRIGMLGFLNMGTESCSGNQGLKDQVMALKWVQQNIEAFSGDKNNVTIFGESAGSASVHYLCISPLAKGLFHKAICQSGVSINPWAFQKSNKEYALRIAAELGNSSSNDEEVVKFLKGVSPKTIIETQSSIYGGDLMALDFKFVPTIDDKCPNPFLPKPVTEMINNGIDVPLIIGHTSHEGLMAFGNAYVDEMYRQVNENFDEYLSKDTKLDLNTISKFSKDVRNYYFKKSPITKEEQEAFIQLKTDLFFVNGILYILENQATKKTPTYFYRYAYTPENSLVKMVLNTELKGACHADELTHFFYKSAFPAEMQLKKGTMDYLLMERMTKMWTDFAKTGNPTPETNDLIKVKWTPCKSNRKSCLQITEELTTDENYEQDSWKMWKPIINKYKLFKHQLHFFIQKL